jgi:hypothetical protein
METNMDCEHCSAPNAELGFYRLSGNDVHACRPCMEQWSIRHWREKDPDACIFCQESVYKGNHRRCTSFGDRT